jgi:hypothetical protein
LPPLRRQYSNRGGSPPESDAQARGCREFLTDIRDGFAYSWNNRPIRAVIILLAAINLTLIGPVVIGGSVLAETHFGGARTFGLIISSWGLGGFVGAIAQIAGTSGRTALIGASAVMGRILRSAFALLPWFWRSISSWPFQLDRGDHYHRFRFNREKGCGGASWGLRGSGYRLSRPRTDASSSAPGSRPSSFRPGPRFWWRRC